MKKRRYVIISAICMMVCAVSVLAFTARSVRSAPATLLPVPQWKIGDWFEVKISHWRGWLVAEDSNKVTWEKPIIRRYEIIGEENVFGHPCFILRETEKQWSRSVELGKYYFLKTDLLLIKIMERSPGGQPEWIAWHRQSPYIDWDLGLIPRFPVVKGRQAFQRTQFTDAKGHPIRHKGGEPQVSYRNTIPYNEKMTKIVQIESSGYVSRWVPGQMWWAQCWQEPAQISGSGRKKASRYRAALYATSHDGVVDYPLPRAEIGGVLLEEKK